MEMEGEDLEVRGFTYGLDLGSKVKGGLGGLTNERDRR
jgi:hypothetical protein